MRARARARIMYYSLLLFFFLLFLWFYVRPLRRNYLVMAERSDLFALSGEVLRNEKRALLENLDEGVITLDGSQRVSFLNLKARSFLGLEGHEAILGRPFSELIDDKSSYLCKEAKRLISESHLGKERMHTTLTLGDQEKTPLGLLAIPIPAAKGVILVIQDRSNQQKILEMGKDFIANASHELRTPVTIIRGFAETLKDLEEVSDVMYDSILEKIIRNCERMENLVKNLLILADLDHSSSMKMWECELCSIVETSCNQILNIHPEIHIEQLHNEDKIPIWGNPDLLELAFTNLLKNAVKYSPAPAQITITIDAKQDDVQVDIADQGIGIPEKDLERVFDRFYTVDKTHSRKLGGAGLGLSIVKIILSKHGGKVWATRNAHVGTTLHLSLLRI